MPGMDGVRAEIEKEEKIEPIGEVWVDTEGKFHSTINTKETNKGYRGKYYSFKHTHRRKQTYGQGTLQ